MRNKNRNADWTIDVFQYRINFLELVVQITYTTTATINHVDNQPIIII